VQPARRYQTVHTRYPATVTTGGEWTHRPSATSFVSCGGAQGCGDGGGEGAKGIVRRTHPMERCCLDAFMHPAPPLRLATNGPCSATAYIPFSRPPFPHHQPTFAFCPLSPHTNSFPHHRAICHPHQCNLAPGMCTRPRMPCGGACIPTSARCLECRSWRIKYC
jgi:hypothetical protein